MTHYQQALQEIVEKTKGYKTYKGVSVLIEVTCYLLFIGCIVLAIYLPYYLGVQLELAEEEIGFYIVDPEDLKTWKLLLRGTLVFFGFFPLVTGIVLRLMRALNRRLGEVYLIATENR